MNGPSRFIGSVQASADPTEDMELATKHYVDGELNGAELTDTTYTFANGTTGNFTVTPEGGTAQTVSIGKPATAGTADKATAANLTTTENAIAKYSDTAGTFANSGVTIDSNNNITTVGSITANGGLKGYVTIGQATGRTIGEYATVEGEYNTNVASGEASHAEGSEAIASGQFSHVEGWRTIAQRRSQHVFGEYNVADIINNTTTRGNYVEIVGNGSSFNARSNARTLDWNGNEVLAGKLTVGADPVDDMDVITKQYFDNRYKTGTLHEITNGRYEIIDNDGNNIISLSSLKTGDKFITYSNILLRPEAVLEDVKGNTNHIGLSDFTSSGYAYTSYVHIFTYIASGLFVVDSYGLTNASPTI